MTTHKKLQAAAHGKSQSSTSSLPTDDGLAVVEGAFGHIVPLCGHVLKLERQMKDSKEGVMLYTSPSGWRHIVCRACVQGAADDIRAARARAWHYAWDDEMSLVDLPSPRDCVKKGWEEGSVEGLGEGSKRQDNSNAWGEDDTN
ncbi:hypothetical protein FPV67DRAFT_1445075 [Lyophyllum atratum]|nr:hypothetical protein FPV67DRAFT_1445075 [Lyophyllum atratum]